MELSRLLEITHDLKTCALCPDRDLLFKCVDCQKVNQITDQDLRLYYTRIMDIITENANLKAENSRLRSEAEAAVNDMQKLVVFSADPCEVCAGPGDCEICHFQWRGVEE